MDSVSRTIFRNSERPDNVFIDFKKAFDRVWHVGMLRVMRHYNIPAKLCSLIKSLYDQAISAVRVGKDISDWFSQTVGVRQGCTLSPDLFNLFWSIFYLKQKKALMPSLGFELIESGLLI